MVIVLNYTVKMYLRENVLDLVCLKIVMTKEPITGANALNKFNFNECYFYLLCTSLL